MRQPKKYSKERKRINNIKESRKESDKKSKYRNSRTESMICLYSHVDSLIEGVNTVEHFTLDFKRQPKGNTSTAAITGRLKHKRKANFLNF